ncbi:hypothetical protein KEM55_005697, partial [Ascosphaera atra]
MPSFLTALLLRLTSFWYRNLGYIPTFLSAAVGPTPTTNASSLPTPGPADLVSALT